MRRFGPLLPLVVVTASLALWLRGGSLAAPAGTLDQLAADFDARLGRALASCASNGRPLRRQDLALSLRAGAGVSDRLSRALLRLLKGKLEGKGLRSFSEIEAGSRAGAERLARAGGYELLLHLELLLVEGQLHLQGDLVATDRSIWRDVRQPDRGALSHLHASVRADAEVRAFQGSLSSTAARFSHQSYPYGRIEALALGAGDVDGDGRAELVLLTSRTVEVLRLKSSGFASLLSFNLSGAAATVRPRRALGTLLLRDLDRDKRAEVLVRSSDFEKGMELAFDGKALTSRRDLDGYPLLFEESGAGAPRLLVGSGQLGQDLLSVSSLTHLPASAAGEWQHGLPPALYALRAARVPGPRARSYVVAVDGAGQLSLFASDSRTPLLTFPRVGVAVDLCDLDDDGRLEVITTGGDGPDAEDQIHVQRLLKPASAPAQLRSLWRSPSLGGQVTALTHGDLDGSGKLKLVAAIRQKNQLVLMVIH